MKAIKVFAAVLMCAAMVVACNPDPVIEEASIKVSPETATFNANSPVAATVSVTANKAWTATSSASWLTISPKSGEGAGTVTLTATENVGPAGEAAEARTAEVTFTAEDKTATVKVTQKAETIVFVVDKTEAPVPADGASVVIEVEYNTPYEVEIPAAATWITKGATKATQKASVTLSVAANDVKETREATVRLVPVSGDAKSVKITQDAKKVDYKKLNSAENLLAFANAVNAGEDLEAFDEDGDGVFVLEANIDLTGVEWPGIGSALYNTALDTTKAFRGVFDGNNHSINNLSVNVPADAVSLTTAGLFGSTFGATIKNLELGAGCVLSSKAANQTCLGSIVGFAMNTTIENCKSAATVNYDGGTQAVRQSIGGLVGSMNISNALPRAEKAVLKGCTFAGKMTSKNAANTGNGGTGISLGGIVGFAEGTKNAAEEYPIWNTIENCVNEGAISGEATRIAGIVASCNNATNVNGCTNKGTISCTDVTASNSRVGGVVSTMNARTAMKDCVNYGTVEYAVAGNTTQGYAAGVVGQVNDNANVVDGCKNFGDVKSDMFGADLCYMGSILGNANSKTAVIKNCQVEGYVGPYTDFDTKKVLVTKENYETYLTLAASKATKLVLEGNYCTVEAPKYLTMGSEAELLEVAKVAAKLGPGSTVTVTADFAITDTKLAHAIDTLRADLIGGGHTITYNFTEVPEAHLIPSTGATPADTLLRAETLGNLEVGLIGVCCGNISNLKVAGKIACAQTAGSGTYHIGGIVGRFMGSTIENCENNVEIVAATQVTHHIGGIAGYTDPGAKLTNCVNKAAVGMIIPDRGTANASQIGGIIGHIEGSATLTKCTNDAVVTYEGKGTPRLGGICGYINNATTVTYNTCINNGDVVWNEGAYTSSSWSYVGGLTGYHGTPTHEANILYKDCVNNGDIKIDITETKSKTRCGGIASHAGISNTAYVENELTWTFDGCVNNGNIVTPSTAANNYFGGILGFAEKTAKCVFKDCTNKGSITCPGTPKMGAIFGGMGGSASEFNNVIVDPECKLVAGKTTTTLGLLVGDNNAFTTKATGRVAGTISNGGTETVTTMENYASYLAGTKTAMGEGWDATGVVFNGLSSMDPLSGTYKVASLKVLGAVGTGAWVEAKDKSWMWNSTVSKEYDNILTLQATGMSATAATATVNYAAGADGGFWDYVLIADKNKLGTGSVDLSGNYGQLPHGDATAFITLSNGAVKINGSIEATALMPGSYPYTIEEAYVTNATLAVPEGSIALVFKCNLYPSDKYEWDKAWASTDFDRFMIHPFLYAMIFTKQ